MFAAILYLRFFAKFACLKSQRFIPLFDMADECYAVANAAAELKERATSVIGCNDEDGVARWLEENWRK